MTPADAGAFVAGFSRFQAGADVALHALEHRAELEALELDEARGRALLAALLVAVGGAALLLAGVAITVLVAAVYWDTPQRVGAITWVVVIDVVLAAVVVTFLGVRFRNWRPFHATREQLRKDCVCLHQVMGNHGR